MKKILIPGLLAALALISSSCIDRNSQQPQEPSAADTQVTIYPTDIPEDTQSVDICFSTGSDAVRLSEVKTDDGRKCFGGIAKNLKGGSQRIFAAPSQSIAGVKEAGKVILNIPSRQDESVTGQLHAAEQNAEIKAGESFKADLTFSPLSASLKIELVDETSLKVLQGSNKPVIAITAELYDLAGKVIYDIEKGTFGTTAESSSKVEGATDIFAVYPGTLETGKLEVAVNAGKYEINLQKALSEASPIELKSGETTIVKFTIKDSNLKAATPFSGGSGTLANPFQIATIKDLKDLASYINDGAPSIFGSITFRKCDYILTSNIDASGVELSPIGKATTSAFCGTFNGDGKKISNFKIANTVSSVPTGLFGHVSDATITDLTLENVDISSTGGNVGAIVGLAMGGTISKCNVTGGKMAMKTASSTMLGGIAGVAREADMIRISDCSVSGIEMTGGSGIGGIIGRPMIAAEITNCAVSNVNIKNTGNYAALIAASSTGTTTIRGCTVSNCEVKSTGGAYIGGIDGKCNEKAADVRDCKVENVKITSNREALGGIFGEIGSGGATIDRCTVENSTITNTLENSTLTTTCSTGGVVGSAYAGTILVNECLLKNTAVKGNLSYVGGIVGFISASTDVTISDCSVGSKCSVEGSSYVGGLLGGDNPSDTKNKTRLISGCSAWCNVSGFASVGGLVGLTFSKASSGVTSFNMINCTFRGGYVNASSESPLVGGLIGRTGNTTMNTTDVHMSNCYGRPGLVSGKNALYGKVSVGGLVGRVEHNQHYDNCWCDLTMVEHGSTQYYGSIMGYLYDCTQYVNSVTNMYHRKELQCGLAKVAAELGGCNAMTEAQFTDGTLLAALNANASSIRGAASWVAGADGYPALSGEIGDPDNGGGIVAPVKKQKVSIIGDSISTFSGWIPNGYSTHYPTSDGILSKVEQTYWWQVIYDYMKDGVFEKNISYGGTDVTRDPTGGIKNSFCVRYITVGIGNPDIVIIHGSRNDWNHKHPLVPGGENAQSDNVPSDEDFAKVFAAADAATTPAQARDLNDTSFAEAYCKLIQMVRLDHPGVKIICVIGDMISLGLSGSIKKCADHYGYPYVDFRKNGYNDTVNVPKQSGSHPNPTGMAYMSRTIYSQCKDYIEK